MFALKSPLVFCTAPNSLFPVLECGKGESIGANSADHRLEIAQSYGPIQRAAAPLATLIRLPSFSSTSDDPACQSQPVCLIMSGYLLGVADGSSDDNQIDGLSQEDGWENPNHRRLLYCLLHLSQGGVIQGLLAFASSA